MIIKTQRSPLALAFDTALTSVGWLGFFYLFTQGVLSLLGPIYAVGTAADRLNTLMPTINSLLIYLAITLFNAAALVIWARYHKAIFKALAENQIAMKDYGSTDAGLFSLMPNQLHDVRDSRVTVIYHADDGGITHLETDRLQVHMLKNRVVPIGIKVA